MERERCLEFLPGAGGVLLERALRWGSKSLYPWRARERDLEILQGAVVVLLEGALRCGSRIL